MLDGSFSQFSNPSKASSKRPQPGGLYTGVVVRVDGGIFVRVEKVSATQIFGPCDVYCAYPVINQKVLCGFLDNRFDEVVILGRATTSKIVNDVDSPVLSTDGANKNYVDNQILILKDYVDNNFD